VGLHQPHETIANVMHGRQPRLMMDIHKVSEVNKPGTDLSLLEGPAHSDDFKKD